MRLLTKTNRYYLLLAGALFAEGAGTLYLGLDWTLRNEVDEQLLIQREAFQRPRATPRPVPPWGGSLLVSRPPLPGGCMTPECTMRRRPRGCPTGS